MQRAGKGGSGAQVGQADTVHVSAAARGPRALKLWGSEMENKKLRKSRRDWCRMCVLFVWCVMQILLLLRFVIVD